MDERYEDASEIEAQLLVPEEVVAPALAKALRQDTAERAWANPREAQMPQTPWPDLDDPMLKFLMAKARASLEAGMDPQVAVLQLAVHAWFEGGVEGYDRGQGDARRLRST